jgi:hypothetical protein
VDTVEIKTVVSVGYSCQSSISLFPVAVYLSLPFLKNFFKEGFFVDLKTKRQNEGGGDGCCFSLHLLHHIIQNTSSVNDTLVFCIYIL